MGRKEREAKRGTWDLKERWQDDYMEEGKLDLVFGQGLGMELGGQ